MHKPESHKASYPAWAIVILTAITFGILNICQLYLLKDAYPVSKLRVGSDYVCFYLGTELLMNGLSPFAMKWYQFPPLAAYINFPLWQFDITTARHLMFFILIAAVLSAYALIASCFESIEKKERRSIFLYGLIIFLLSYPFYFLICRGHIIGIVIMLLAMGIYLLKKNNSASSVCFALSIGMIVFPVLIFVPLFLFRRYKIIFYTVLTIIILVLLCPDLWFEYIYKALFERLQSKGWYMVEQNCSLTNTFYLLMLLINKMLAFAGAPPLRKDYWDVLPLILYPLMFLSMAVADFNIRKKNNMMDGKIETALTMMYLPFMIAVPRVSFQYNLVLMIFLIPVVCFLMHTLSGAMPKTILWLFIAGIFLTQIQAHSLQALLIPDRAAYFHFFPGFGLFLIMIGCVSFKLWFWRKC